MLSYLFFNYLLSDDSDEGSDIVNDHRSIEILTGSENGQHGNNLQLQGEMTKFIPMAVLLSEKNNKIL